MKEFLVTYEEHRPNGTIHTDSTLVPARNEKDAEKKWREANPSSSIKIKSIQRVSHWVD